MGREECSPQWPVASPIGPSGGNQLGQRFKSAAGNWTTGGHLIDWLISFAAPRLWRPPVAGLAHLLLLFLASKRLIFSNKTNCSRVAAPKGRSRQARRSSVGATCLIAATHSIHSDRFEWISKSGPRGHPIGGFWRLPKGDQIGPAKLSELCKHFAGRPCERSDELGSPLSRRQPVDRSGGGHKLKITQFARPPGELLYNERREGPPARVATSGASLNLIIRSP